MTGMPVRRFSKEIGGYWIAGKCLQCERRNELGGSLSQNDMNVARYLVQGVDVWLNNPRRPLEASGTSGMKVPVNGGLRRPRLPFQRLSAVPVARPQQLSARGAGGPAQVG